MCSSDLYAADELLVNYTRSLNPGDTRYDSQIIADWNALKVSQNSADASSYFSNLYLAAKYALIEHPNEFYLDGTFGAGFLNISRGLDRIDLWVGGLAESKVDGGMLGTTFDFIFANQLLHLQNGDRFYYLDRLAGTNLLTQIDSQLFSDVVMRNTGASHLYSDI